MKVVVDESTTYAHRHTHTHTHTHTPGAAAATTTTIAFTLRMATILSPIQTLKFRSPNPKPLFSPKPPPISTPLTFRADKLTLFVSSATSSATVSTNGPPSPPSPARSKHVFLFCSLSLSPLRPVSYCSVPIRY